MRTLLLAASAALALALPASAQEEPKGAPAPSEIVAAAPKSDWVAIPAEDLLVMTLAPDAEGKAREVVIQLMPAPFSQGWVHNIRLFARAKWYDGISVNRVQDNYVTQWGDPNYDNPEATGKAKPLPEGLKVMGEAEYVLQLVQDQQLVERMGAIIRFGDRDLIGIEKATGIYGLDRDVYGESAGMRDGWPVAMTTPDSPNDTYKLWPTHCYGMVGVGRNYSPDTGSGAELYTVIGHAPRHLDRNIALVGRVIEGMQHLSSLPRGSGALGFYTAEESAKRTAILTVRVASDLPAAEQPAFEYLSTESTTFATYAEAIANRRDPFFIVPAGGADICNIRVPVRRVVP
ncbi:peptidylprolyl isomerase [Porphyrobacter sp. AAP60]|uniref:peptidylprolyl isomerase n=1 Tax=Porphyrobacter sp. AAP60 TaxID=1523423 RepID=UPI0006B9CCDF|nr:peptidylprolyl isomerase [Porphyrobacter sp. AAP60]KPF65601.1 peptidylprolyl isomerase [Porphyrobacter sp. AAP60]